MGAFPPLLPIPATNRLSSVSKGWPCDTEVDEWPRLWPQVSKLSEQVSETKRVLLVVSNTTYYITICG